MVFKHILCKSLGRTILYRLYLEIYLSIKMMSYANNIYNWEKLSMISNFLRQRNWKRFFDFVGSWYWFDLMLQRVLIHKRFLSLKCHWLTKFLKLTHDTLVFPVDLQQICVEFPLEISKFKWKPNRADINQFGLKYLTN